MEIIFVAGAAPRLAHADILNAFAARVVEPYPADDLALAFASVGVVADDLQHVFIDQDWIRHAAASLDVGPDWPEQFAKMIVYADTHGWMDSAGRIRAHIARVGTAEPA